MGVISEMSPSKFLERAVTDNPFDSSNEPLCERIIAGLSKLCIALRSQSWQGAGSQGLTPTQGQILALLHTRSQTGTRLSAVAAALAVSAATASDAVSSLVKKGLVARDRATDDRRAISIRLTATGQAQAVQAAQWPHFLVAAVDSLSPLEQEVFFRSITKVIRTLQAEGRISAVRMCATCKYFRARVHIEERRPHHCALVDAPFGDADLRLDCPEHEVAA